MPSRFQIRPSVAVGFRKLPVENMMSVLCDPAEQRLIGIFCWYFLVSLMMYSSVTGLEHFDADADRLWPVLRHRIRNEGSRHWTSINVADRAGVDPGSDVVVTDTLLSSSVHSSVARPYRDLVWRRLATGQLIYTSRVFESGKITKLLTCTKICKSPNKHGQNSKLW